jgi:hypothetical protein
MQIGLLEEYILGALPTNKWTHENNRCFYNQGENQARIWCNAKIKIA